MSEISALALLESQPAWINRAARSAFFGTVPVKSVANRPMGGSADNVFSRGSRSATVISMSIIPDDKDWTWVLVRPCLDCGFDASHWDVEKTPQLVAQFTDAWLKILLRPDVTVRPSPQRWSPLEYACHVRDVFRLFSFRLQSMVAEDGAHFENWDQDQTAIDDRYDLQDPTVVAHELAIAGEDLAAQFARVSGPLWTHKGIRSNGSEFTIATFAIYFAHDPFHHLWDVESDFVVDPTGEES